jgi:hypothetical protein
MKSSLSIGSALPPKPQNNPISQPLREEVKALVKDSVSLSSAQKLIPPATYSPLTKVIDQKKPLSIIFPEGKILYEEEYQNVQQKLSEGLEIENVLHAIENINSLDSAAQLVLSSLNTYKQEPELLQTVMGKLFEKYNLSEIISCQALAKLKIKNIQSSKEISYTLNPKQPAYKYKMSNSKHIKSQDICELFAARIKAKHHYMAALIINNKKTDVEKNLRDIFNTADFMLNKLKGTDSYQDSIELIYTAATLVNPNLQESIIAGLKHHWVTNKDILLQFSELLFNNKKYTEVIDLLESVVSSVATPETAEAEAGCNYYLGMTYLTKDLNENALKYFKVADKLQPNDALIARRIVTAYLSIGSFSEAVEFTKKLPESDTKKLLECTLFPESNLKDKLKQINIQALPVELKPELTIIEIIADFNFQHSKGFKINYGYFTKKIKQLEKLELFPEPIIIAAIMVGLPELAKETLQKIPEAEIAISPRLQKLQALLDSSNKTLPALITSYKIDNTEKTELFTQAASACLSENNGETAINHVIEGLKLEPKNEELAEIGLSAALALNNQEKAQEFMELLSPKKKEEIAQAYSADSEESNHTTEPLEITLQELIKVYDPKEEHQRHTIRKQQELAKIQNHYSKMQNESFWKMGDQELKISETVSIGKYRGLDCWAIIDDKIQRKVKDNIYTFNSALQKGIITEKFGKNGVKFLADKAVELKIDGDKRLFTNIMHVNNEGKLLIIFDHEGNHEAVDHFVHKSKLTYISFSSK